MILNNRIMSPHGQELFFLMSRRFEFLSAVNALLLRYKNFKNSDDIGQKRLFGAASILKVLMLLVVFCMPAWTLQAQNKKASQILEEVSEQTQAYKNIKVNFAYTMENKEADIYEQTQGTLMVAGNKYHLSISGQEVMCDGTTIWTLFPESKEVQVNAVGDGSGFTPQKLLSNYTDDYEPKRGKDVVKEGKMAYMIKLKPKNEEGMVKNAMLWIDKQSKQLIAFVFYDYDGNSFTYSIKEFITNSTLPNKVFSFDASQYPDVEVIDMR